MFHGDQNYFKKVSREAFNVNSKFHMKHADLELCALGILSIHINLDFLVIRSVTPRLW